MHVRYTLTAYLPYIGGAQVHIHSIARRLATAGHDVRALAVWDHNRADWLLGTTLNAPRKPQGYELDGVIVDRLALSRTTRLAMLPWVAAYYPAKPLAIVPLARLMQPYVAAATAGADIVHTARVGREPFSLASLWSARAQDVPFCITTLHHPKWMGAYDIPYHLLYRAADAVFALTNAEREMLVRLGVREERITVVGHGAEVAPGADGAAFREQYGLDGPIVLFMGEKRAYKGYREMVEAAALVWRRHPDTRFVFVGPATDVSRSFFAEVDEPRILELGAVSLQEKTDALAACDIFCLPSAQESFGGVYLEAWTQAKPVVGCDIPAVRDVIDDGSNGLLVQQSAGDIADKLSYLLEHPAERERLGAAGRRKGAREYSWDAIVDRTLAVYDRLR